MSFFFLLFFLLEQKYKLDLNKTFHYTNIIQIVVADNAFLALNKMSGVPSISSSIVQDKKDMISTSGKRRFLCWLHHQTNMFDVGKRLSLENWSHVCNFGYAYISSVVGIQREFVFRFNNYMIKVLCSVPISI